jgi:hypothetical protein
MDGSEFIALVQEDVGYGTKKKVYHAPIMAIAQISLIFRGELNLPGSQFFFLQKGFLA